MGCAQAGTPTETEEVTARLKNCPPVQAIELLELQPDGLRTASSCGRHANICQADSHMKSQTHVDTGALQSGENRVRRGTSAEKTGKLVPFHHIKGSAADPTPAMHQTGCLQACISQLHTQDAKKAVCPSRRAAPADLLPLCVPLQPVPVPLGFLYHLFMGDSCTDREAARVINGRGPPSRMR